MKNKTNKAEKIAKEYSSKDSAQFDPNGSWTGVPKDKFEKPIQDADDL